MKQNKPNFIVFMTEHQKGDTLLSDNLIIKPNVDAFREKAVTFTRAYCPSPHCCPSRATFFSGLYPSQHGVWNNVNVSNCLSRGLYDGVQIFSSDMKNDGYDLFFSGKWHVSAVQGPDEFGFEKLFHPDGYRSYPNKPNADEWNYYTKNTAAYANPPESRETAQVIRPGYPLYTQYGVAENPFGDMQIVGAALDKLKDLKDTENPFLMYIGINGVHDPYYVPQRFLDMYPDDNDYLPTSFDDTMEDKPALYRRTQSRFNQLTREEHNECVRRYYAYCTYVDWQFGRILEQAEESGFTLDNTVVMYLSDHGDYAGAHGLWAKGLPCFLEAYNVCSMIGGCGIANGGSTDDRFVSLADYAPTILELAGIEACRDFAGSSLAPVLHGEEPENWRSEVYTQSNGNEIYGIQRAVWDKKWKYVFNAFDFDELYDLENDPHEMKNLLCGIDRPEISEYADIVRRMCTLMWQFAYDHGDNCVNPYIMTAMAPYGPGIIFEEK